MDPSRRRWLMAGLAVGGAAAAIWRIIAKRVPQGTASAVGDVRVNGRPASPGTITPVIFVIKHTDEELILLESLVGRVPPFRDQPVGQY